MSGELRNARRGGYTLRQGQKSAQRIDSKEDVGASLRKKRV